MTNLIEIKPAIPAIPPETPSDPAALSEFQGATMDQKHVRWPPERFYWAVLDGSSLPRNLSRRRRREQLGYLFENVLPGVAIEEMQTVYVSIDGDDRHVIACGITAATLHEGIERSSIAAVLTLTPAEIPEFAKRWANAGFDPEQLNMLSGELEPMAVRQCRRRTLAWAAAMLLLISSALTIGLQRRIGHSREQLAAVEQYEREIHRQVLGSMPATSSQPPHLRLVAELRQLQQTRQPSAGKQERSINIVRDFEQLVTGWPNSVYMQTESVVIADQSITIRGRVPTMADVQILADELASDGWTLQQPQSNQVNDRSTNSSAVELSLRLDRAPPVPVHAPAGMAKAGGS